jgi:competence protein ComEA
VDKKQIGIAVAALAGAVVLLRPVPPPAAVVAPAGWAAESPGPGGGPGRRSPPPRALVYVAGDVMRPGVYTVGPDARARDALALAGGARPDADLVAVNLAAHVGDGDEIVVPVRGSAAALAAATGRGARARGRAGGAKSPHRATGLGKRHSHRRGSAPASHVDLNTADAETLATIPGIGGGLAQRIVAFRQQNGPFATVDELLDVSGITEHRLDALIPYVTVR